LLLGACVEKHSCAAAHKAALFLEIRKERRQSAEGARFPAADHWACPTKARRSSSSYVARLDKPIVDWTAFFVELTYASAGKYPFMFTTAVRILRHAGFPGGLELGLELDKLLVP
jgi:hypothetical protein